MLTSFKLALALIDVARAIFRWLEKQGFIDEGRAQVILEQTEDMNNEIRLMRDAADAVVDGDRVQMADDPDDRANWPKD